MFAAGYRARIGGRRGPCVRAPRTGFASWLRIEGHPHPDAADQENVSRRFARPRKQEIAASHRIRWPGPVPIEPEQAENQRGATGKHDDTG